MLSEFKNLKNELNLFEKDALEVNRSVENLPIFFEIAVRKTNYIIFII